MKAAVVYQTSKIQKQTRLRSAMVGDLGSIVSIVKPNGDPHTLSSTRPLSPVTWPVNEPIQ